MKRKIIDLNAYRSSKTVKGYVFSPACDLLTGRDIDKLVKDGKWMGTYTPKSSYGKNKEKRLLPKKGPSEG